MGTFILRRLLQLLFVLWGGATLLFILFYLVGGNPAERMASGGGARNPDPQVVANLEARLGLDKSKPQQYVSYLSNIVRGDLGESFRTREPVVDIAKRRAPTSFRLAFWAVIIEATVGIGSGMLSARKRNSVGDYVTTIAAVVASAIPVFVLAYMLRQLTGVYAYQHDWPQWARFPTIGMGDDEWVLGVIPTGNTWRHLIQPAFVLAAVSTAMLARITRTSMLETMRLDHVRTARAKGLGEKQVMRHHVLRNAMIPVITVMGLQFAELLAGTIVVENVFYLPGLGRLIFQSIANRDLIVVRNCVMLLAAMVVIVNFIVDVLYAVIDPRVKASHL